MHYDVAYSDVTQSDHDYDVAVCDLGLSAVNLTGGKLSSSKYARYLKIVI